MKLPWLGGLAAMALPMVLPTAAQARVRFGLGFSFGLPIAPAYYAPAYCGRPYYYSPAYVAPAYVPPPVVYSAPPVVYDPPAVVFAPPPVVYDAPVVAGPFISTGFFYGGHGDRYYGHTHYGYRHR